MKKGRHCALLRQMASARSLRLRAIILEILGVLEFVLPPLHPLLPEANDLGQFVSPFLLFLVFQGFDPPQVLLASTFILERLA
jgi:hypothetical protein